MRIEARLARLEKAHSKNNYSDVLALIRQGVFYDELTEEQRQRYAEYRGTTMECIETVETAVCGCLHFLIEQKPTPGNIEEISAETEKRLNGQA